MTEGKAAVPKTELVGVSQRMQQSIEDQLAALAQGVADCLETARKEPASDYDTSRSSDRRDAAQFVSSTAELLQAIAKLKGEFRHDYHVTRVAEVSAAEQAVRDAKKHEVANMRPQREVDAMSDEEYVDYHRSLKGLPPKYPASKENISRRPGGYECDELAALEEEVARVEKLVTTPHPENRGSNAGTGKP